MGSETNKGNVENFKEKNVENNKTKTITRRYFLERAAAAGAVGAGLLALPNLFGKSGFSLAQETSVCAGCEFVPKSGDERADMALNIRYAAAKYERDMPIPNHPCNEDEARYANRNYFASFTKGLKRANGSDGDIYGEVDPVEYCKLLMALKSGDPADFEAVALGFNNSCLSTGFSDSESRLSADSFEPAQQRRLETPQAGLNYDLEGKDYHQLINRPPAITDPATPVAFPIAPVFKSAEEVTEIIENYWQALTRDVPFRQYGTSSLVYKATDDLNQFKAYYTGPLSGGNITPAVYSRGVFGGDTKGPFISQFLILDAPYGVQTISAKLKVPVQGVINDFVTEADEWRMIQKGQTPNKKVTFDPTRRFIRSGRDLGEYVHNDAIYQAYLNAALIMLADKKSGGLGIPINPNNPYNKSTGGYCKQNNFVEFGPSQLLTLIGEVSVRAHKAVWYQKWNVHRRLRPEEFGGRAHFNQAFPTGSRRYPINSIFYTSNVISAIEGQYHSLFLPQAFPEGSPMHPAYGAGHATLAGACVTILKAWFDSEREYTEFAPILEPTEDGLNLVPFGFTSDISVTVADELNKLASNISIGRNIAGVHWRSDYTESVFLGEKVAIQLLEDYGYTYNEKFVGFRFRNFDGQLITVGGNRFP